VGGNQVQVELDKPWLTWPWLIHPAMDCKNAAGIYQSVLTIEVPLGDIGDVIDQYQLKVNPHNHNSIFVYFPRFPAHYRKTKDKTPLYDIPDRESHPDVHELVIASRKDQLALIEESGEMHQCMEMLLPNGWKVQPNPERLRCPTEKKASGRIPINGEATQVANVHGLVAYRCIIEGSEKNVVDRLAELTAGWDLKDD
jgi:hypothetical protein